MKMLEKIFITFTDQLSVNSATQREMNWNSFNGNILVTADFSQLI